MNSKERLLEKIRSIVHNENRSVSFKDLLSFDWNGQQINYKHGSLRNLISELLREGKIEVVCRSPQAFYTFPGINFGKAMTPTYIMASPNLNYKQKTFLKFLRVHELNIPAIHDIRLLFTCEGLRSMLLSTNNDLIESIDKKDNKDIKLKDITLNDITLKTIVHNSNKVTVIVACSDNPIALDYIGIAKLSSALTRVEDRLQRVVEDYTKSTTNQEINKNIEYTVPCHLSWIITMWHFGYDSEPGFSGESIEITWKESLEVFRIYSKKRRISIIK
ncbi:MAG: hypothetical protein H0X03_08925 [Nitrosopumilus sp.]|nr:hypothetical protein [Nitrosopumilus sp.]